MKKAKQDWYGYTCSTLQKITTKEEIENSVMSLMVGLVGQNYAKLILKHYDSITENTLMEDVIEHVLECSCNNGMYQVDDIKAAIGKEIMARLGIEE